MPLRLPRRNRRESTDGGPSRGLPTGWVRPSGLSASTAIGALDATTEALVDPRGLVTPWRRAWSLDWWIGAEDRWHLPAREPGGVRQSLLGAAPVVETRVRVPGGDAVQRVYGVRGDDGAELTVIELENASTLPFAVALAVRPYGADGRGRIELIDLDDTTVMVEGAPAVVLPKPPRRSAASTKAGGDSAAVVLAGEAGERFPGELRCQDGLAQAAFIFPLAHTATLRAVLPASTPPRRRRPTLTSPASVPAAAQVSSGWAAQSDRGLRLELPDPRLQEAVDANRRYLLARPAPGDASERAEVAVAADRFGFDHVAAVALATLGEPSRRADAGAVLWAIGNHWRLIRDRELIDRLVPAIAGWAELAVKEAGEADDEVRARSRAALLAVGAALRGIGDDRAGGDAERLSASIAPGPADPEPAPSLERLGSMLDAASPTWTWAAPTSSGPGPDIASGAAFLSLVRSMVLREDEPGGLAIASLVPPTWLGQGWEVHDAPTAAGRFGYAVRWHGERPALLWELHPHPGAGAVRLTAPGLDPVWASTEPRGEALLSPAPPPTRRAAPGQG